MKHKFSVKTELMTFGKCRKCQDNEATLFTLKICRECNSKFQASNNGEPMENKFQKWLSGEIQ